MLIICPCIAQISVASVVIYSLPPTSRQPLVVTPFQPVPTFITATLPDLLGVQGSKQAAAIVGGKGKNRETTSELDYALLEGLTVATCVSSPCSLGPESARLLLLRRSAAADRPGLLVLTLFTDAGNSQAASCSATTAESDGRKADTLHVLPLRPLGSRCAHNQLLG